MKKKVLAVLGTRPEAIKLAPVIKRLKAQKSRFTTVVCATAQHRHMLDQVLSIFKISPDYDLNIMKANQDLFDITQKALKGLKHVLETVQPDIILVQGDTTTAFIAGLAAFYLKIPAGHVEAGLRTYNKHSPFPEEINRHLLSVLADYHFAPTEWSRSNLLKEGIPENRIWVTGNTVIDALMEVARGQGPGARKRFFEESFRKKYNLELSTKNLKLILVTGHRRENFGEGFENICNALRKIAEQRKDVEVVYPVHLNPNVQRPVKRILGKIRNVHLIEPLGYEEFVFLMNSSFLILTDSGGIQEEAPSLGKPVLVMRNTTERPEGIEAGVVKLVGTGEKDIIDGALELLEDKNAYRKMSRSANPYGDGRASKKITDILFSVLQ
ncbi:MAG TPA: UDP-N-acetylglucosamine 2-epimerase (non-hydrolyzing) [Syntrophorhabdaceae bacterium]|nr:UDP-N-acetylglucosamine 2-epimerase (non-hydrolyzing) [Syntrophorhabdaceae bacterium]HNT69566.1 UDP-N-acetylglucosamine 2-epimerase (non-hydrolyzing) [Syntrophorhabdaceae bacterium]